MFDWLNSSTLPQWAVMWVLSFLIYVGLKLLSWSARTVAAPAWKHVAYLVAWPGMDVDTFLSADSSQLRRPTASEWMFALLKMGFGIILIWIVVPSCYEHRIIAGWVGMVGIVFVLHFGLFHLLSCLWRSVGIAAVPIMNWPVASQSVSEFWGRRWNMAFRDLTHRFLFRPLIRRIGPVWSLLVGFFVSGVVHDVVISVPAGGGYGLPTCFFILQGIGILFERSAFGRRLGLGHGLAGRLFCWCLIALPSPLLFHHAFNTRVILPFLAAIGAAS